MTERADSALFKECKCTICNPHWHLWVQYHFSDRLYKVQCKAKLNESTNSTQPSLTLNQLHCHMGHISPTAAKHLVKEHIVTGLHLDMSSKPGFCITCAKSKTHLKAHPKEQSGPRAVKLIDKVHSDVWGPATPKSYDSTNILYHSQMTTHGGHTLSPWPSRAKLWVATRATKHRFKPSMTPS